MKKAKRHQSLIPLSREHHYALMICLRINRGLPARGYETEWLQSKARQVTLFFASDLAAHFKAEEEVLFPAMRATLEAASLIEELCDEHRRLERLVQQLSTEAHSIAAILREFAGLLEAHIRKEERLLFPIYEREISTSSAEHVERDIRAMIGPALKPKHPELLEP